MILQIQLLVSLPIQNKEKSCKSALAVTGVDVEDLTGMEDFLWTQVSGKFGGSWPWNEVSFKSVWADESHCTVLIAQNTILF